MAPNKGTEYPKALRIYVCVPPEIYTVAPPSFPPLQDAFVEESVAINTAGSSINTLPLSTQLLLSDTRYEYVPTDKDVVSTPNQFVEYGKVPPEIFVISAVPLFSPLHKTSVVELLTEIAKGSVIVTLPLSIQPLLSNT